MIQMAHSKEIPERNWLQVLAAIAVACVLAFSPTYAMAFGLDDLKNSVNDGINNALTSIGDMLIEPIRQVEIDSIADTVQRISEISDTISSSADHTIPLAQDGKLTGFSSPDQIMDAGGDLPFKEVLAYAVGIYNAIKPICYTILGLVFAIQFVKILQQPDNPVGSVPYVEKFAWMWIKFAILKLLLDESINITVGIFNIFAKLGSLIATGDNGNAWLKITQSSEVKEIVKNAMQSTFTATGLAGMFNDGLMLLFAHLIAFVVMIIAFVAIYGRWFQLFIYLPFAPLFFALLGEDETKQMFWSYIRSIVGLGLAFVITIVVVKAMPAMLSVSVSLGSKPGVSGDIGGYSVVGVVVLIGWCLTHAGQWAHDMIGS